MLTRMLQRTTQILLRMKQTILGIVSSDTNTSEKHVIGDSSTLFQIFVNPKSYVFLVSSAIEKIYTVFCVLSFIVLLTSNIFNIVRSFTVVSCNES